MGRISFSFRFFLFNAFLDEFPRLSFSFVACKKKSDRKKTKYSFEDRKSLALVCLILDCYFTKKNISVSLKKKTQKKRKRCFASIFQSSTRVTTPPFLEEFFFEIF